MKTKLINKINQKTNKQNKYFSIAQNSVLVSTPIDLEESINIDKLMDSEEIFHWTDSY